MTSPLAAPPVGVGYLRHADAFTAARETARQAREQLPVDAPLGWLLAFVGGQHDPERLLQGFQSELGNVPVLGGCGAGVITAAAASATGYECGVLLFPASLMPSAILSAEDLDENEVAAGRRLGTQLRDLGIASTSAVLLFYDSVKSAPPPVLHIGSRLLDGLYEGLADSHPVVIGAGTLADLDLSSGYVFDRRVVRRHAAVAVALPPTLAARVAIMHGCRPASQFLEITRLEGARVLELDGRPALSVVAEHLGLSRTALIDCQPVPSLTLGAKHGNPYAAFNDDQYVNRLVIAIDPADESLILFEADFHVGARVQLMVHEPGRMIESAREQTRRLLAGLGDTQPLFGLYIDCAGRSTAFSGLDENEADAVRAQVGARCPLLGLYSGVEIAPFRGRARPLDWTGVLILFARTT